MISTTVEQSKRLLALGLDKDTADMTWKNVGTDWLELFVYGADESEEDIPAWSLGALLEIMPKEETPYIMYLNEPPFDEEYRWECGLFNYIGSPGSSPIEAAFQMACWLLKNGYIKKGGAS